ncbi:hypothetical protein GDO81_026355 [Engystomops pustulosus]|uniref:Immunoglobulin V-set domain-containing protein n=1 Tax=Engystomops pustulosus TaxID=76066 RepID=A0AAV6ZNH9_ENGPU|nr:hypothetical protein GDO81_026355 [Engystomops pustulosus]
MKLRRSLHAAVTAVILLVLGGEAIIQDHTPALLHGDVTISYLPTEKTGTVSEIQWTFDRNGEWINILFITGNFHNTYDSQFSGRLQKSEDSFTLTIRNLTMEDAGIYTIDVTRPQCLTQSSALSSCRFRSVFFDVVVARRTIPENKTHQGLPESVGRLASNHGSMAWSLKEMSVFVCEAPSRLPSGNRSVPGKMAEQLQYNQGDIGHILPLITRWIPACCPLLVQLTSPQLPQPRTLQTGPKVPYKSPAAKETYHNVGK